MVSYDDANLYGGEWDKIGVKQYKAKIDGASVYFRIDNKTRRVFYYKDTILLLKENNSDSSRKYNLGSTLPNRIMREEEIFD